MKKLKNYLKDPEFHINKPDKAEVIKGAKKFAERMQSFEDRLVKLEQPDKPERKKCYLCEKPPITHIRFDDGQSFVSCVNHDPYRLSVAKEALKGLSSDPVPPLNVRVAQALELDIKYIEGAPTGWYYWFDHAHGLAKWKLISPYDTDLTLAMGALEEYCKGNGDLRCEIIRYHLSGKYRVYMGNNVSEQSSIDTLPTAICEAICEHSEEK